MEASSLAGGRRRRRPAARAGPRGSRGCLCLSGLLQDYGGVVTADAEVGAEDGFQVWCPAWFVHDVVEACTTVGDFGQVPHRWDRPLLHGQGADGRLDGAARAEGVAEGGLRR